MVSKQFIKGFLYGPPNPFNPSKRYTNLLHNICELLQITNKRKYLFMYMHDYLTSCIIKKFYLTNISCSMTSTYGMQV